MIVESIEFSWFRGASKEFILPTNSKNIVVYGSNGAGKSTFADGLEYIVRGGKVEHLSHEYSGARQVKGVRNTHTPDGDHSIVKFVFNKSRWISADIAPDGSRQFSSEPKELIKQVQAWDLKRLLLRQDEIANFIIRTKSEKYSVLLPLLGLEELEQAAENLKKLNRAIENKSELESKRSELERLKTEITDKIGELSDRRVLALLQEMANRYSLKKQPMKDLLWTVQEKLVNEIATAEPVQKRHLIFQQLDSEDYFGKYTRLIQSHNASSQVSNELIDHHIKVLEATNEFSRAIDESEETTQCPACGQEVSVSDMMAHIQQQLSEFGQARELRNDLIQANNAFSSAVDRLRITVSDKDISSWLNETNQRKINSAIGYVIADGLMEKPELWTSQEMDQAIGEISSYSTVIATNVPQTSQKLFQDNEIIDACYNYINLGEIEDETNRIELLVNVLQTSETTLREFIRMQTKIVIDELSEGIQYLWSKLHPDEPIEDISLYLPDGIDKAIDIELKFFGVSQPSPRNTLSEGHRNSLGLSIFLALVRSSGDDPPPIVLDDIVSSMDREHRGMLVDVLKNDFPEQQILLFTCDREWYSELTARLPRSNWDFLTLKPWADPIIGIQQSESKYTFDDARKFLADDPEAAANTARGIMDTQLSIISEILKIPLQYLRGDSNDRRGAIEFLNNIISRAKKKFHIKQNGEYIKNSDPFPIWEEAKSLLIAWGNPASHGRPLTGTEAERLLEICEMALNQFVCGDCGENIWLLDHHKDKYCQCNCGIFRWKR